MNQQPSQFRAGRWIAGFAIALLLGATQSGCSAIKFGLFKSGPIKVPPRYVPAKVPLVVYVKDAPDPSGLSVEADEVAGLIEAEFKTYDITPIVDSSKIADLRSQKPAEFNLMSPSQIGREVGALQVLYVQILASALDRQSTRDMAKGRILAQVSVLEAGPRRQLWPADGTEGISVGYETKLLRLTDRNTARTIERDLHMNLAERIGQLFRQYKPDK